MSKRYKSKARRNKLGDKPGIYVSSPDAPMSDALAGLSYSQDNMQTSKRRHGVVNFKALAIGGTKSGKIVRQMAPELNRKRMGRMSAAQVNSILERERGLAGTKQGMSLVVRSRTWKNEHALPARAVRVEQRRFKRFSKTN